MMSKNGGKVMPADSIRPCLDQRSDVGLGRLVLPYHGSCSECLLMCAPRTNARTRIRHAKQIFSCRVMPPGTAEISRDACGRKNAHAVGGKPEGVGSLFASRRGERCPLRSYFFTSGHSLASNGFAASSGEIVAISL